jgi:hypothetical protein
MTRDPEALVGRQVAGDIGHEMALRLIAEGEIAVEGRLVAASNATLYCTVTLAEETVDGATLIGTAIYKPVRGEAPL